jgi:hypothetical protein
VHDLLPIEHPGGVSFSQAAGAAVWEDIMLVKLYVYGFVAALIVGLVATPEVMGRVDQARGALAAFLVASPMGVR